MSSITEVIIQLEKQGLIERTGGFRLNSKDQLEPVFTIVKKDQTGGRAVTSRCFFSGDEEAEWPWVNSKDAHLFSKADALATVDRLFYPDMVEVMENK